MQLSENWKKKLSSTLTEIKSVVPTERTIQFFYGIAKRTLDLKQYLANLTKL
jgi:hypothetical protein